MIDYRTLVSTDPDVSVEILGKGEGRTEYPVVAVDYCQPPGEVVGVNIRSSVVVDNE